MYPLPLLWAREGQTSTNPPHTSVRWMRKNSTTGDGAVPRSRNRSRDISSGSRSEHGSGIRAMNGCDDRAPDHKPTVSHGVTYAAVCTYGCGDGRIAPTRCAVIDAGLDGRSSPHQACKTLPAGAGSAHSALVAGSGPESSADLGGSLRSRTTSPAGIRPCGDASLARSALGTHPCPLHSCPV